MFSGLVSKLEELRSNSEQFIDLVGATLLEWVSERKSGEGVREGREGGREGREGGRGG